jgi:predicted LPLAT superfamily acyltransferase
MTDTATNDEKASLPPRAAWLAEEERGSVLAIRFVVLLCNLFGRTASRAFIRVLMLYYTAFARSARRASQQWLEIALGREVGLRDVYRHLTTFALVALDRIFLVQGKRELFELESHGTHHLRALADEGRGAILLGAHLGSFEAMRARGAGRGYDIHVLAYVDNARKITSVLKALNNEMHERVIALGSMEALLRARDVQEQGGMLAMLGDRTGLNEKQTTVDFFGRPAPFPTGPFLLAHSLRCPVFLVFGLYKGGNRYDLFCEPFAERVQIERSRRAAALQTYEQQYAAREEHHARHYPYNWYNLYDYWTPQKGQAPTET